MLIASSGVFAQITVSSNGNVKLADDLNINHYYSTVQIVPDENNSAYLGLYGQQFSAIYGSAIYANGSYLGSDKRIKENFRNIDQALPKILKMKGQEYDFIINKSDSTGSDKEKAKKLKMKKDRLGFIAQDMLKVLPEAVYYDEDADKYFIEYNAIIPVIVEAMKEQQATIDDLTARIEKLEGNASKEKSATIGDLTPASLNQNVPNPFTANTTINMCLPNTVTKAILYIYNMQGEQIKQLTIHERGNTSATIEGHSLKAGIYLYTLIADDKEVDTHKMILTK